MIRAAPAGAIRPSRALSSTCFSCCIGKFKIALMSVSLPWMNSWVLAKTWLGSIPRDAAAPVTHRSSSKHVSPPSRHGSSPLP